MNSHFLDNYFNDKRLNRPRNRYPCLIPTLLQRLLKCIEFGNLTPCLNTFYFPQPPLPNYLRIHWQLKPAFSQGNTQIIRNILLMSFHCHGNYIPVPNFKSITLIFDELCPSEMIMPTRSRCHQHVIFLIRQVYKIYTSRYAKSPTNRST